jgi:predicted secreted protein
MNRTTSFKKYLVIALVLLINTVSAKADFTFGEPTNLGPPVNTQDSDGSPHISPDGLLLYFQSGRLGGSGVADLWVSARETPDDNWGTPVNLGSMVNSSADDWAPSLSPNGLELFFTSKRPGGPGGFSDIWLTTRATLEDDWGEPEPLGPNINTSGFDGHPSISSDGLELYFCCWDDNVDRSGGYGTSDIWVTSRMSLSEPWAEPVNLGETVNSPAFEGEQDISADGLCLVFSGNRPGGSGGWDLWVTTRKTKEDPWGDPVNLGPEINSTGTDAMADISDDGSILFFASDRSGKQNVFDIWQLPILPIVDLNGDGIVDGEDLRIIGDHWGTDDSLCDIGPMPWGDGIVNVQDLIVIAEYLQPAAPEDLNVDEQDDGGQVELEQGQILVVTLESNPTTGYSWQQAENQPPILEQIGDAEFISSQTGGPPIVGAGGWEIFRFKAISPGQMTLKLIYHRPWEEGVEPVKTFSLDVIIY